MKCLFASNSQSTVSQRLSANTAGQLAKAIQFKGKIHPEFTLPLMCDGDGETRLKALGGNESGLMLPFSSRLCGFSLSCSPNTYPQGTALGQFLPNPVQANPLEPPGSSAMQPLPSEPPGPGKDSFYLPSLQPFLQQLLERNHSQPRAPKPSPSGSQAGNRSIPLTHMHYTDRCASHAPCSWQLFLWERAE